MGSNLDANGRGWPMGGRMVRAMALLAGVLALGGCASVPTAQVTQERFTRPAVGEISSREVGEPLFEVEVATRMPGVRIPLGTQVPGVLGLRATFKTDHIAVGIPGEKPAYCGPATLQPAFGFPSEAQFYCITEAELKRHNVPYSVGMITRNDPSNFRQQLLYQGKSGNELKVSYREFSGDLARPAFTQDLTFDLSEGAVIGTKGARVEVIEATNTTIKYRLLQPFGPRS